MNTKKNYLVKRIFSLVLAFALMVSGITVPVQAATAVPAENATQQETKAADVIEINTAADLEGKDPSGNYVLTADITLDSTRQQFQDFTGTFDGKGHTVTFVGGRKAAYYLFRNVEKGAVVKNVRFVGTLRDTDMTSTQKGPCGNSIRGTIINCVTEMEEGTYVCGFGKTLDGGTISNCLSLSNGKGGILTANYTAGKVENTYWKEGLRGTDVIPADAKTNSGAKTDAELRSAELLAALNQNRGADGSEWIMGNGHPVLKAGTPAEQNAQVDKTPLEDAIKNAEALVQSHYDKDSWEKLQATVAAAKAVLSKEGLTQDEVAEEVKKLEASVQDLVEVPYVYFKYDNGKTKEMDENNTFTLSALDAGTFVLGGTEKNAKWECETTIDYVNKHHWLSTTGRYQPRHVEKVDARVVDADNTQNVIKEFKINNVASNVEELKVFVGNQEISVDKPYEVQGSSKVTVNVKGKVNGEWVSITSSSALEFDKVSGKGIIRTGGTFQVDNNSEAIFKVVLLDSGLEAQFKGVSNVVHLEGFELTVPKVWYIHEWNGLGNYYLGIMIGDRPGIDFQCKFTPQNAGNKRLLWKSLTPDVANYMEAFQNGIIPEKAGIAKFEVTSEDNPKLKQDVEIEFRYKNPLESATVEKDSFTMKEGEYQDIDIATVPEHASEQRFNWTYSEDGIVRIGDAVNIDPTNVGTPKWTTHTLTALKAGVVKVKGTPLDTTKGCKPVEFTVTVTKDGETPVVVDFVKVAKEGIKHGVEALRTMSMEKYSDEWTIFSALRAGDKVPQEKLDKYYKSVEEKLAKDLKDMSPRDLDRIVITLEAMGKDPSHVGGINLFEELYNSKVIGKDTSNSAIWTLIALDGWKTPIPKDATWTREKLIERILTFQTPEGAFGLTDNKTYSVDMTGMALQSLAPYYKDAKYPEVTAAVDKALDFLKSVKTGNAGYLDNGAENSCTTAQVLTAVTALKIDPVDSANGFTMGKNNMITNLMKYKVDKGFAWHVGEKFDGMSTQQVTYALTAYERFAEGRPGLYDMSDTKKDDGNENNDGIKLPEGKHRFYGANRYKTAIKAADALKTEMGVDKFSNIIVAAGSDYPDALSGNYLAKVKNAPTLLVDNRQPKETLDYIKTNLEDKGTVYLLGGKGVISEAIRSDLEKQGYKVVRLGGRDRYETNLNILKAAGAKNEDLLVCSGLGFADSLSASAAERPILLVGKTLVTEQKAYLAGNEFRNVYLIGGAGVVSNNYLTAMKPYSTTGVVERVAGVNRYATSVAVAEKFFNNPENIVFANGSAFPDGLAGGTIAMSLNGPMVLVGNNDKADAMKYAAKLNIKRTVILGGPTLISDSTVNSIVK